MSLKTNHEDSPSIPEVSLPTLCYDKLEKGSSFCIVKDLDLACCLVSIGIKIRVDPPVYNVKLPNGNREVIFYFSSSSEDGSIATDRMINAYYNDAKFIQENPDHPMSYAIATIKNKVALRNSLDRSIPCLAFRRSKDSGAVIYVQEGSKKHQNCVAKGMVHVDPKEQVVAKTRE